MNKNIEEAIERNTETDDAEIARHVADGCTSGILDNEEGYRISWELKVNKFAY